MSLTMSPTTSSTMFLTTIILYHFLSSYVVGTNFSSPNIASNVYGDDATIGTIGRVDDNSICVIRSLLHRWWANVNWWYISKNKFMLSLPPMGPSSSSPYTSRLRQVMGSKTTSHIQVLCYQLLLSFTLSSKLDFKFPFDDT